MDAVLPAGPGAAFPRNSESTAAVKPISTAGPDGITHLLAKFSKKLECPHRDPPGTGDDLPLDPRSNSHAGVTAPGA